MSDVNFTIGGTPAPFISAMQKVTEAAKESAAKVTESFGVEGLRGERAIRGRFIEAFHDISKNGSNAAEAIGGAFTSMAEGLKLSMGSMIALLAVSELVKGMYSGWQAAEKMKSSVKDALSIDTDVTHQSVEKVQDSIKKLNEDAEATNLSAMSSLQAGATAVMQAFEEGKSIAEVVKEDAEEYNELKQKAHDMEDQQGAKSIENENAILALKAQGRDAEAEALQHHQQMQEKLDAASEKHNQATIDALNREKALQDEIADKEAQRKSEATENKTEELQRQIYAEQMSRGSDADKLKLAKQEEEHAKFAFGKLDVTSRDPVAIEQARLEWEKTITKEKSIQDEMTKKTVAEWQKANDREFEAGKKQQEAAKKALELAEQKAKLLKDQSEAQQALGAAQLDSTLFHGEASSLAKTGLGGRVSGPNYGNQAQLKAAQDAAKHLADIKAEIAKLSGSIGVAN